MIYRLSPLLVFMARITEWTFTCAVGKSIRLGLAWSITYDVIIHFQLYFMVSSKN